MAKLAAPCECQASWEGERERKSVCVYVSVYFCAWVRWREGLRGRLVDHRKRKDVLRCEASRLIHGIECLSVNEQWESDQVCVCFCVCVNERKVFVLLT